MKITGVTTIVVGNEWKNWVFVKVATDEGLIGIGEATGGLQTKPNEAAVEELKSVVIGLDPRDIVAVVDSLSKALFLGNSVAISGIEQACWDILGKSLGVPVWRLLGGKLRPSLRAYANGWYRGPREPGYFAEAAAKMVERGYTALKFDPFGKAYRTIDRTEEKLSLAIIRAVRDAVGDEVDILIEGHDRFAPMIAVRLGRAMEEFAPMWFETPVHSSDIQATVEVARRIRVPVAAGERSTDLKDFADLAASRSVGILQPEVLRVGGISGLVKVAAVAEANQCLIAPHNAQSPLCTAVNAHVGAAASNFLILECFDETNSGWTHELFHGGARIEQGFIGVPDQPGLGIELDEEVARRHPYGAHNFLRLFEEGWERRRGREE